MSKNTLNEYQLFEEKNAFLGSLFSQVEPFDFYRELFPEGSLESPGELEEKKPNMIVATCYRKPPEEIALIEKREEEEFQIYEEKRAAGKRPKRPKRYKRRVVHNRIVFDDLKELPELISADDDLLEFVIIPPVAFSGKNRTKENAYHMWGITVDLDGVEMRQLEDLIHQIQNDVIPEPTFISNSGHGMHLYYCFEEPVPMYPYMIEPLQALKNALTDCIWNAYTSTIPTEKRQYQSIVQGYRAVRSVRKLGNDYRIPAFRTGNKRTLEYLMEWAEETNRVDFDEFEHTTLDEARKKWPEWQQKRVIEGKARKPFKFKHRGVYEAWLRRMELGAFDGNRYNCIAVLFALAYKTAGIEYDEVLNDAIELAPRLNRLTKDKKNEFTVDDVLDASSYYDEPSQNLGLKSVYRMTKIHIKPTPRRKNPLKRDDGTALKAARMFQDMKYPNGEWRNKEGRPKGSGTAEQKVREFRMLHPEASKAECHRITGLDPKTIRKWWNTIPAPAERFEFTPGGVQTARLQGKKTKKRSKTLEILKKSIEKENENENN